MDGGIDAAATRATGRARKRPRRAPLLALPALAGAAGGARAVEVPGRGLHRTADAAEYKSVNVTLPTVVVDSFDSAGLVPVDIAGLSENPLQPYVGEIIMARAVLNASDGETCGTGGSPVDDYFAIGYDLEVFSSGFCQWSEWIGVARRVTLSTWNTWNSARQITLEVFSDAYCSDENLLHVSIQSERMGPFNKLSIDQAILGSVYLDSRSVSTCVQDPGTGDDVEIVAFVQALFSTAWRSVLLPPSATVTTFPAEDPGDGRRRDLQGLGGEVASCAAPANPSQIMTFPAYSRNPQCIYVESALASTDLFVNVVCSDSSEETKVPAFFKFFVDDACSLPVDPGLVEVVSNSTNSCIDVLFNETFRVQLACKFYDSVSDDGSIIHNYPTFSPTPLTFTGTEPTTPSPTKGGPSPTTLGLSIGLVPVLLLLAGTVYVLVTRRRRKTRGPHDRDRDEVSSQFDERMPKGKKVSRRGTLSVLGLSMTMLRVSEASTANSTDAEDDDSEDHLRDDDADEDTDFDSDAHVTSRVLEDPSFVVDDAASVNVGATLGRGAHGRVYAGTFQGSQVAIKDFKSTQRKPEARKAFLSETQSLRALQHPNIIRLYGVVVSDTQHQLILERAEHSLADLVERRGALRSGITIVTMLQWAEQICVGASFMHSKGIVHMDLKPSNILLDHAWNVKISDFGSSIKDIRNASSQERQHQPPGSLAFMAPERFEARARLTSAVDVYAFGITLWQMLHREEAMPRHWTVPVAMQAVSSGSRPEIAPSVPDSLADIMDAAWESSPSSRPTFEALKDGMSELLGTRTIDARGSSALSRRPAFERGQHVALWDQDRMCFTSFGVVRKNPSSAEALVAVELEDGTKLDIVPTDLL